MEEVAKSLDDNVASHHTNIIESPFDTLIKQKEKIFHGVTIKGSIVVTMEEDKIVMKDVPLSNDEI